MSELQAIETDATTEAAKVKAEVLTEVSALELTLTTELAKLRAEIASPHGQMLYGIFLFVLGALAAIALRHL